MEIDRNKAIELFELIAGDNYGCVISDIHGNNQETSDGSGFGMAQAIESGEYIEFNLEEADKGDAVKIYNELNERGSINGEGFDEYDYHKITVVGETTIETSFIPVGGW